MRSGVRPCPSADVARFVGFGRIAMLHGGWSRSPVRFLSGAVAFRRAQFSVITTMLLRGAWARFLISTVVWVGLAVQRQGEKR